MDNINRSRTMSQAKTMLDQNIPIEVISQQLGLDRNTLNNLLMQNQLMPDTVMQPQDYRSSYGETGIMSNPVTDTDSQRVIDGIVEGGEESQDIIEFLGIDLGVDLNEGEDTTQTVGQALTSGSVAGVLNNQDSFMSYLDNASLLESLTDEDKLEVYKKAAAGIIGEPDYESLITQPDKVMPYLAAGLSLINSGEKDEDWGAALGKAFITGYGTKRKEEKTYDKSKQAIDLARQNQINQLVTTFGLQEFKDKSALNQAIVKSKLKAPIAVDIVGDSGTFFDKSTVMLDESSYAKLARTLPGSVRESENRDKEAYTLIDKNNNRVNTFLNQDEINYYSSLPSMAGKIIEGHREPTNLKLYTYEKDGETVEKFLSPTQFNDLTGQGIEPKVIPLTGQPKYVYDKIDGQPVWVMPNELAKNGSRYREIGGFNLTVGADGEINISEGSSQYLRSGIKQYKEVNNKLLGVDRAVENYFISADQMDKAIGDFTTAFPDQSDLIFNNMAGNFTKFADNFAISLGGFTSLFSAAPEQGGSTFYVGENKVDFDSYKDNIIGSAEFAEFRESPFAKMLESAGITGARLDAALFDMAMIGAGSYNIDKGLDLRAISDFETKQFMKIQGGEAASLAQFQAVANDFRTKLVKRNISEIERVLMPSNLLQIKTEDGKPDIQSIEALKESGNQILEKLQGRLSELENLDTSSKPPSTSKLFVTDPSIDPDNPDVVTFQTITANPESAFGQKYGLTAPLNTEFETEVEGTFREMLNKYSSFAGDINKQNAYFDQLQKTLSPAEFAFFQAHIIQAQKLGL